jgi:CHAD domain-containing protein
MTGKSAASKREAQRAGALVLAALDERWKDYRTQVKTCRREFSEEAVHDLRVAMRRLLGVLDIARALYPHARIQKTRRFLKDQLDDLNDLRDVQVMLVEVSETIEDLPALRPFKVTLEAQEKRLLRLARKRTRVLKASELSTRIAKTSGSLRAQSKKEDFHERLLLVIDNAYEKAARLSSQVDVSQPETIHRLRLAFKKFHYMAEIAHPLIPNYPESSLKGMHDYQSMMGDIQDIETFLNALADFSERDRSSIDPKPIRRLFKQRHAAAIAAFLEHKSELVIFWRAAPTQSLTVEQKHDPVHRPSRHRRGGRGVRRGRQPAPADGQGPQEDAIDRARIERVGGADRPDPDQPVRARGADGTHPGEEVRTEKGKHHPR